LVDSSAKDKGQIHSIWFIFSNYPTWLLLPCP
jgi:hypothetical protein